MKNVILIIGLLCGIYLFIRNYKVYMFRVYIIDLIHDRTSALIDNGASYKEIFKPWDIIINISYTKMLSSFKPLKMKYWLTKEELKLLGYESKRLD